MTAERSQNLNQKPVLIYQMGKVGSFSIYLSLSRHIECVHFHTIPDLNLPLRQYSSHAIQKRRQVLQALEQGTKDWKIITAIREPIARNISLFFNDLCSKGKPWYLGAKETIQSFPTSKLIDFYFSKPPGLHASTLKWFNEELQYYLNIDIYEKPFEPERGYRIYKMNGYEMLLIRQENLRELGSNIIGGFLGINNPNFEIGFFNVGAEKWYADIQNDFIKKAKFSKEYIDSLYHSKYCTHFYSPHELKRFREKYMENS